MASDCLPHQVPRDRPSCAGQVRPLAFDPAHRPLTRWHRRRLRGSTARPACDHVQPSHLGSSLPGSGTSAPVGHRTNRRPGQHTRGSAPRRWPRVHASLMASDCLTPSSGQHTRGSAPRRWPRVHASLIASDCLTPSSGQHTRGSAPRRSHSVQPPLEAPAAQPGGAQHGVRLLHPCVARAARVAVEGLPIGLEGGLPASRGTLPHFGSYCAQLLGQVRSNLKSMRKQACAQSSLTFVVFCCFKSRRRRVSGDTARIDNFFHIFTRQINYDVRNSHFK